jgi:hypothetical protein
MSAMRSGAHTTAHSGKGTAAPPPTIVFHGDRDIVVHPSNAKGFLTYLDRSDPGAILSFPREGTSGGRDFTRRIPRRRRDGDARELGCSWKRARLVRRKLRRVFLGPCRAGRIA